MPTKVIATEGDSLCNIAHVHGFADCTALRADAANAALVNRADFPGELLAGDEVTVPDFEEKEESGATEQKHEFQIRGRIATIRFVHGSPNIPYLNDSTLNLLNVSNYVPNRAGGPDGSAALPSAGVRQFQQDGHNDPDTFKVELTDSRGSGNLAVEIEALRPIYDAGARVTGHKKFPTPRKLDTIATIQGSSKAFRTCYLKLVTSPTDQAQIPDQCVLVSDMHDEGDSQVEILDQLVKASYEIPSCAESPKCRVTATLPIGTDRRRLRLKMHVLRMFPEHEFGDSPVVPIADVERRVFTWFRRIYAQAGIGPKLAEPVHSVDPPANLVSVSNDSGLPANGDGTIGFTIHSNGGPDQVVGPITPAAGATPLATARALAARISAPYTATVSENPARFVDPVNRKSADIVITEAGGAFVTIDSEFCNDSGHTLNVGVVDPFSLESWATPDGNNNWNAGSLQQRTALKNIKDQANGDRTVDLIIADTLSAGNRGEAMMSNHRIDPARPSIRGVRFAAFMAVVAIDGSDNNPFSFPHEVAHVAGEVVHAPAANHPTNCQMMVTGGTPFTDSADAAGKRIRDGAVRYDGPVGDFNLIQRIRVEGASLLENW